jgi:Cu+-exporting ATPase
VKIETKTFRVEGMSCASCVKKVESAIAGQTGVQSVAINLASETANVSYDSDRVEPQQLETAVAQIGYRMQSKSANVKPTSFWTEQADFLKLLSSAFLTLPLLLPMFNDLIGTQFDIPTWLQLGLATPIQFVIGFRFYSHSWRALKNRSPNMDVLVAIGTTAAFGLSVYLGFFSGPSHPQHLYFESSAVIITLVLLGKYLEKRAKQKTTAALRALESLKPDVASVERNGNLILVPIFKVVKGDRVVIRPGDRVPVDGHVLEGSTTIDESLITGESLPVTKGFKDKVVSGSLNIDGLVKIEAQSVESESTLSQIIRLMEDAHGQKAPIQKLVDRVSEVFVPTVIMIALFTLFGWKLTGSSWETALINCIAVLVIACPCALGLATPTALMVGRGLAAKKGILIKEIEALEKAFNVRAVIFDKTGTLTEGNPELIATHLAPGTSPSTLNLVQLAASIQQTNTHPLAKASVSAATQQNLALLAVTNAKIIPGKGSEAITPSNEIIQIGSRAWLEELGYLTASLNEAYDLTLAQGYSTAWIGNGTTKTLLGFQSFADQVKKDSGQAIERLHQLGLHTILLTGDKKEVADLVGHQLKIGTVIAEVKPKEKLSHLLELRKKFGTIAMVGDGINDAPALAAADLGIAMAQGTDVAIGAAAITLMRSNPLQVVDAITVSRTTYRKLKQNLFWAFFYNAIGIPLACMGLLNPMIAASAMAFSSVSVVGNSLLIGFGRKQE